jgi:hypothetical protein
VVSVSLTCIEIYSHKTGNLCINVILRRVLATIVAVENNNNNILCVCVCSLSYPACNARAEYCYLCPALQNVFTLSNKWHDFRKRVTEHKICVLTYSTILSEAFSF